MSNYLNDKCLNDLNTKLFEIKLLNDECQNDLSVKPFDVRHSNDECQMLTIQPTSLQCVNAKFKVNC